MQLTELCDCIMVVAAGTGMLSVAAGFKKTMIGSIITMIIIFAVRFLLQ